MFKQSKQTTSNKKKLEKRHNRQKIAGNHKKYSKRESIFVKYVQDTHTHTYTHVHMHTTHVLYTHILAHIAIQVHSQARRKKKRCCSKDMEKEMEKMNYIFKYTRDTNTKTRYTHIRKRRDFDNHVTENAKRIHSQK